MKKIITILTITLFNLSSFAQPYQWQWAKAGGGENKLYADIIYNDIYGDMHYHEEVVALKNTSDNNTYLLSHVGYGNTNYAGTSFATYHQVSTIGHRSNIFLSKVDCEGNYLWHKIFGGGMVKI